VPHLLFETPRLQVRRLEDADLDALLAVYGDAEAMRWVGDGRPLDRARCEEWLAVTRRNVNGAWLPTFANAEYITSRTELEAQDPARGAKSKPEGANLPFIDSVQPILDAGMMQLVNGDEQLFEGIDLMPIPGHTPGQMAIRVRSRGEEALFAGDIAHQVIQVAMPDWSSKFCADPKQSAASRRRIWEYCAETNCLMLPVHFGWPFCGRIARKGAGFAFVPHDKVP